MLRVGHAGARLAVDCLHRHQALAEHPVPPADHALATQMASADCRRTDTHVVTRQRSVPGSPNSATTGCPQSTIPTRSDRLSAPTRAEKNPAPPSTADLGVQFPRLLRASMPARPSIACRFHAYRMHLVTAAIACTVSCSRSVYSLLRKRRLFLTCQCLLWVLETVQKSGTTSRTEHDIVSVVCSRASRSSTDTRDFIA